MKSRHHIFGTGVTTLVAFPGGPGVHGDYLRMPGLEERLTVV